MALERLSKNDLIKRCEDIFYDYLISPKETFFDGETFVDCDFDYPTPLDLLYKNHIDCIEECRERIIMLSDKGSFALEEVDLLTQELKHLSYSNMEYQKELYEKEGNIEYSRNMVLVPLDKRINSFYDDLFLEVVFYDNISVPKGEYNTYRILEVKEVKKDFVKRNTEITNMALVVRKSSSNFERMAMINLLGEFDESAEEWEYVTKLNNSFADFSALTLKDTTSIGNNDLRQWLQTKIDLDKEELFLVASKVIRGDEYKLFLSDDKTLFIRYVCPSTGRVYYNQMSLEHLRLSSYFSPNTPSTYIDAWWNIVHLGAPVEGENWIRC